MTNLENNPPSPDDGSDTSAGSDQPETSSDGLDANNQPTTKKGGLEELKKHARRFIDYAREDVAVPATLRGWVDEGVSRKLNRKEEVTKERAERKRTSILLKKLASDRKGHEKLLASTKIRETELYQLAYAAQQARYPIPDGSPHWLRKKYEEAWQKSADDLLAEALVGEEDAENPDRNPRYPGINQEPVERRLGKLKEVGQAFVSEGENGVVVGYQIMIGRLKESPETKSLHEQLKTGRLRLKKISEELLGLEHLSQDKDASPTYKENILTLYKEEEKLRDFAKTHDIDLDKISTIEELMEIVKLERDKLGEAQNENRRLVDEAHLRNLQKFAEVHNINLDDASSAEVLEEIIKDEATKIKTDHPRLSTNDLYKLTRAKLKKHYQLLETLKSADETIFVNKGKGVIRNPLSDDSILDFKYGELVNSPLYLETKKRVLELSLDAHRTREVIDAAYQDSERIIIHAETDPEEKENRARYERYIHEQLDLLAKQSGWRKAWLAAINWTNQKVFAATSALSKPSFRIGEILDKKGGIGTSQLSKLLEAYGTTIMSTRGRIHPDLLNPHKLLAAALQESKAVKKPLDFVAAEQKQQLQRELDSLPLLMVGVVVPSDKSKAEDQDSYWLYADTYAASIANKEVTRDRDTGFVTGVQGHALFEEVDAKILRAFVDPKDPDHQQAYREIAGKLWPLLCGAAWDLKGVGFGISPTEGGRRLSKAMVALREALITQEKKIVERMGERKRLRRDDDKRGAA